MGSINTKSALMIRLGFLVLQGEMYRMSSRANFSNMITLNGEGIQGNTLGLKETQTCPINRDRSQ